MIRRLLIVLQILKDNDLYVKPEKCIFFTEKVEFLGFIIEDGKNQDGSDETLWSFGMASSNDLETGQKFYRVLQLLSSIH